MQKLKSLERLRLRRISNKAVHLGLRLQKPERHWTWNEGQSLAFSDLSLGVSGIEVHLLRYKQHPEMKSYESMSLVLSK